MRCLKVTVEAVRDSPSISPITAESDWRKKEVEAGAVPRKTEAGAARERVMDEAVAL